MFFPPIFDEMVSPSTTMAFAVAVLIVAILGGVALVYLLSRTPDDRGRPKP
jgi:hypothetical protein